MRAISNSSVLIALSSIGQLSILTQRFPDGILIPQAVWYEVVETGAGRAGATEVATGLNVWLTVQEVENKTLISLLQQDLDNGEAEAIALLLFARIAATPPRPGYEAVRAKLQKRRAKREAKKQ